MNNKNKFDKIINKIKNGKKIELSKIIDEIQNCNEIMFDDHIYNIEIFNINPTPDELDDVFYDLVDIELLKLIPKCATEDKISLEAFRFFMINQDLISISLVINNLKPMTYINNINTDIMKNLKNHILNDLFIFTPYDIYFNNEQIFKYQKLIFSNKKTEDKYIKLLMIFNAIDNFLIYENKLYFKYINKICEVNIDHDNKRINLKNPKKNDEKKLNKYLYISPLINGLCLGYPMKDIEYYYNKNWHYTKNMISDVKNIFKDNYNNINSEIYDIMYNIKMEKIELEKILNNSYTH